MITRGVALARPRERSRRTGHSRAERPGAVALVCSLMLLWSAGAHIALAYDHAATIFAVLSFLAGATQACLAVGLMIRPSSTIVHHAIVFLNLVLIQLYVLNVTVGLPPIIAHSHVAGDHQVGPFTLAWPGTVDWHGRAVIALELASVACAVRIWRPTGRSTSRT